jgi:hypothetical protein
MSHLVMSDGGGGQLSYHGWTLGLDTRKHGTPFSILSANHRKEIISIFFSKIHYMDRAEIQGMLWHTPYLRPYLAMVAMPRC